MLRELNNIPQNILKKLYEGLTKIGYPMSIQYIVDDEAQSWLATSYESDFNKEFNFNMQEIEETHLKFKNIFDKYKENIKSKKIC